MAKSKNKLEPVRAGEKITGDGSGEKSPPFSQSEKVGGAKDAAESGETLRGAGDKVVGEPIDGAQVYSVAKDAQIAGPGGAVYYFIKGGELPTGLYPASVMDDAYKGGVIVAKQ